MEKGRALELLAKVEGMGRFSNRKKAVPMDKTELDVLVEGMVLFRSPRLQRGAMSLLLSLLGYDCTRKVLRHVRRKRGGRQ